MRMRIGGSPMGDTFTLTFKGHTTGTGVSRATAGVVAKIVFKKVLPAYRVRVFRVWLVDHPGQGGLMLRRISKIVFYTLLLLCAAGLFLCAVSYFRQPCATFTGVFPDAANGRHHIVATAGICRGRISIEWTRIVDDRRPGSVSADVDPHFAWSPGLAAMPPVPLRRQLLGFEVDGDDRSYPAVMEGIDPAMQARITAQAYDYLRSRNLAPNEEAVKRVSSGTWTTTRHEHHASEQVPLILPCLAGKG